MWFGVKVILSALIIASTSWLAGRKPVLAGFLIASPVTSMLGILFAYVQYRDMAKVNEFAVSILIAVPLSLLFFVPFVLNKWIKLNFPMTYILGVGLLALGYLIHSIVERR